MTITPLSLPVYLDGHATTPLAPRLLRLWSHGGIAALPMLIRLIVEVLEAAQAVEIARAAVGDLIGAGQQEIFFTSGATEANNLALLGVTDAAVRAGDARREIIVSAIEHKSVLGAAEILVERGFVVHVCPVTRAGRLDISAFSGVLSERTLLVSIMGANNEVGTVQPIEVLLPLIREAGAMIHVDLAQLAGKLPVDASDYDFASLSSHKLYGPMGIGALFVSAAAQYRPRPLVHGGSQEGGIRPGTLPTPLIVGFGAAAELAHGQLTIDGVHARTLAARLVAGLEARQVRLSLNAPIEYQLPGSLSIRLHGIDASSLINRLSESVSLSEGLGLYEWTDTTFACTFCDEFY